MITGNEIKYITNDIIPAKHLSWTGDPSEYCDGLMRESDGTQISYAIHIKTGKGNTSKTIMKAIFKILHYGIPERTVFRASFGKDEHGPHLQVLSRSDSDPNKKYIIQYYPSFRTSKQIGLIRQGLRNYDGKTLTYHDMIGLILGIMYFEPESRITKNMNKLAHLYKEGRISDDTFMEKEICDIFADVHNDVYEDMKNKHLEFGNWKTVEIHHEKQQMPDIYTDILLGSKRVDVVELPQEFEINEEIINDMLRALES
jgi:hypothetical protein